MANQTDANRRTAPIQLSPLISALQSARPALPAFAWLAFVVAGTLAPVAFEIVLPLVPPDTVQATASTHMGSTVVTHEITDPRVVADLYARINDLPYSGGAVYHCTLPGIDPLVYTFRFTRWGMPLETASPPGAGCAVWQINRGWLDEPRVDLDDAKRTILTESRLPLPLEP